MNTRVFLIKAKTSLHVGDEGGTDFSIIDKTVQRDPLTGLPCIHSSSLKGALNEYCTKETRMDVDLRIRLFGCDKMGLKKETKKGEAVFFDVQLLCLPRQRDEKPFDLITSRYILDRMMQQVTLLGGHADYSRIPQHEVLDFSAVKEACLNENLPIIARNVLDDGGISKNLWYEQVLPAETVLYTVIQEPGEDLKKNLDGKVIQIGANATIGYGYCKFELI